ncbi:MAG: hypothetical protein V5A57_00625 [Candidatus Paceibacterota bacterium]
MDLEELQEKPDSTKKKIIIAIAVVLILILGAWWVKDTINHLKQTQREGIDIEFPASE